MTLTLAEALALSVTSSIDLLRTAREASALVEPQVAAHLRIIEACQRALEEHREREMKDRQAREAIRAAAMQYRGQR